MNIHEELYRGQDGVQLRDTNGKCHIYKVTFCCVKMLLTSFIRHTKHWCKYFINSQSLLNLFVLLLCELSLVNINMWVRRYPPWASCLQAVSREDVGTNNSVLIRTITIHFQKLVKGQLRIFCIFWYKTWYIRFSHFLCGKCKTWWSLPAFERK